MNDLPILRTYLLDILWELRDTDIPIIIGGGYGIFLKTEYVRTRHLRTLLDKRPESRSTSDLDLFLRPELLIEPGKLTPLAKAIERLGYIVIPTAQKYQFVKPGPGNVGEIKIDLLTGPQSKFSGSSVKVDRRRVRPKPSVGLHAHTVDEAPSLEKNLFALPLSGMLTQGIQYTGNIFIPHPYTYLMMKLFAFKDRCEDESKEFGRYHALDLYSIIATTTEDEWLAFSSFRNQFKGEPSVQEAAAIVGKYFSMPTALGMIRMRESHYYRPDLQIDLFIELLRESFSE
jgi:hypothetical protein